MALLQVFWRRTECLKKRKPVDSEATRALDARLARGRPQADLRLCREVASLDQEARPLTRTCDRLSRTDDDRGHRN